jgi:hypothetical protein
MQDMALYPTTNEALWAQEEVEDKRLIEETYLIQQRKEQSSCTEENETTPWLKHTKWPVLFRNRPLDILTASALQPSKCDGDYYLGQWSGIPLTSPAIHEAKLRILMRAVDHMFIRAEETLKHTHYRLRCWLQTYHERHFRPVAFSSLQSKNSRTNYISMWKRFICYVFRLWATDNRLRETIYGVSFRQVEAGQLRYIWSTLLDDVGTGQSATLPQRLVHTPLSSSEDESDEEADTDDDDNDSLVSADELDDEETEEEDLTTLPHNQDEVLQEALSEFDLPSGPELTLAEALFQLSMMFWTFQDRSGDMTGSIIIHFTGVCSIHRHSLAYKAAYSCTSDLARLVWIGRLLFLEYALPIYPYKTLRIPWPGRDTYPDQATRLDSIRTKYLLRGGFSPMSEIIELKAFGKSIIKKEGARTNLTWAADGQSFTIGSSSQVRLLDFTYMHKVAVTHVEERIHHLMLGWQPEVDLNTIRDDFTCRVPGYSFLQEEENGLRFGYKALSRRAWSSSYRGQPFAKSGRWLTQTCSAYFESESALNSEIFTAMYLRAGLPARGPEITSVKVCNTAQVIRSLIFREGRLLLVIEYNKARASNYHAYYVVRYLPPKLAWLVYLYLAYVRPFAAFLAGQLRFPHLYTTEFLFPDPQYKQKHMSSAQATIILKRLTQRFPTPMSLSLYRQSALAISKRYIKKLIQAANFYKPKAASDPVKMIATGAGHHPQVLLTEYAIDSALPARLQPELLEMYLQLSTLWQDWNDQYYQDHRHLWTSTRPNFTPRTAIGSCPKSSKRILPCDSHSLSPPRKRKAQSGSRELLNSDGFQYNAQYKILICISCESALQTSPAAWYSHLNSIHRILGPACKALIERFRTYDLCPAKDLVAPHVRVPPIPGLRIQSGFRCRACPLENRPFMTRCEDKMMDHMSSAHHLKPSEAERTGQYISCLLQTIFLARGRIQYFEVEEE